MLQKIRDMLNAASLTLKMTAIIITTTSVTLIIASGGFIVHDYLTFQEEFTEDITALADVIAGNVAAPVMDGDWKTAQDVLSKVKSNRHVNRAFIVTQDGKAFASYLSPRAREAAVSEESLQHVASAIVEKAAQRPFLRSSMEFVRPVVYEGRNIALVAVQTDIGQMTGKLPLFSMLIVSVWGVSFLVAWLLATRLQRFVSRPIMNLSQMMKRVSEEKNYSLRAPQETSDEIGVLIDGFNSMLAQIQTQDETLRLQQEHLRQLAHYDDLTALPNRVLFNDRLTQALHHASRERNGVAVIFIDLDGFKDVNDTLGHKVGDLLLKEIANRLVPCIRKADTVARLGGDEFVLCLVDVTTPSAAAVVAEKILEEVALPFIHDGKNSFVTASIGISIFPQDGSSAEELVKHADAAMYDAKRAGKNAYRFYRKEMQIKTLERLEMQTELRLALERRDFTVWYLPKVAVSTGEMTGLEALVRWKRSDWNEIPPERFLPVAEECGLMVRIGEQVLREVCRQLREWLKIGLRVLPVAVNLSAVQFRRQDLITQLVSLTMEFGINPSLLELELTESAVMEDPVRTIDILKKLKTLGFRISIDDFGTGYSSLGYLKQLPLDSVKIDRSFVGNIPGSRNDAAVIEAILAVAGSMGFNVVAEGVEKEEQLDFLRGRGCHEYQGFLLAEPIDGERAAIFLTSTLTDNDGGVRDNAGVIAGDVPARGIVAKRGLSGAEGRGGDKSYG